MFSLEKYKALQYQLHISIKEAKGKYYTKFSSRLVDPLTSPNTYWSILKTLLNNKNIPCMPHLFHENKFITDLNSPSYLFSLRPNFNRIHNTRLNYNIPSIKVRHGYFKNSSLLLP